TSRRDTIKIPRFSRQDSPRLSCSPLPRFGGEGLGANRATFAGPRNRLRLRWRRDDQVEARLRGAGAGAGGSAPSATAPPARPALGPTPGAPAPWTPAQPRLSSWAAAGPALLPPRSAPPCSCPPSPRLLPPSCLALPRAAAASAPRGAAAAAAARSEEHTSELQSLTNLVCRL